VHRLLFVFSPFAWGRGDSCCGCVWRVTGIDRRMNKFGAEGAKHLAEGLKGLSGLQTLDLG
jgi:hypothetical protein